MVPDRVMKRYGLLLFLLWVFFVIPVSAQKEQVPEMPDTIFPPQGPQIPGPLYRVPPPSWRVKLDAWKTWQLADYDAWLADLKHWRQEYLVRIGYDGSEYDRPELQWTQRNFILQHVMVEDRYFYDPATRKYTVDRYLDYLDKRYGGPDSVLIWPVYPNIGIDNRNQWDLHRDLPGGIPAIREMVQDFHRHGVKVLFPTMVWDMGTRDEGVSHAEATARLMAEIGADGVFGDTLPGVPRTFRTASDKTGHPVALEPETAPQGLDDEGLMWNMQSLVGLQEHTFAPPVNESKWLEPRHIAHFSDNSEHDPTDGLQYAFFNGIGFEDVENWWGIWLPITPRGAEALRRVAKIERTFAELLVSPAWRPYVPTLQYGIFATQFPRDKISLWTFINRNNYDVSGSQIEVTHHSGRRYFDVWHGLELTPRIATDRATLSFEMESGGFGAVLALDSGTQWAGLDSLLRQMHDWSLQRLSSFSDEWKSLPQEIVEIPRTKPSTQTPPGMVGIPDGEFTFSVHGIEVEGGSDVGVDAQEPWEDSPRRYHYRRVFIHAFYVDRYPVTNAQFRRFLDSARYHPQDDLNFLRDWQNGTYPAGWENKPVTWVSLEDARAYAQWAGKRLPHEWEWQYAAQGSDGRLYPWGKTWDDAAVPVPDKGRTMRGPDPVDAHPRGASPFGVMDMVGNVWQWTDEYVDEHTRAAILRGGSYYQPQGSSWYFPQAYQLDQHGKYLLMAPSKDRSGTVGFRCVMDE
jgi:formylglycine-generating enzyme required for sulfatase activity